jgi:dUTP pyrophosphatase
LAVLSELLEMKAYRPDKDLPLVYSKDEKGNAGWDLYATEMVEVGDGEVCKVLVNAHFAIPTGYFGFVVPRSGLSSEGINIIPGTIDSNFRGQISAIVQNVSGKPYKIERGLRLAQIIFIKHEYPVFKEVESPEELGETVRGNSGFGDSGQF